MVMADTGAAESPSNVPSQGLRLTGWRFALLMVAALAVSMAYGVTLPLMPSLVERLGAAGAEVARHTGWLTAVYTLGLFLFSPLWGALSDRLDRRVVMALGLVGGGVALGGMDLSPSLATLYFARGAAGVLSAAVLPAVFSYIVEVSVPGRRQKRFAWVASATALGFLLGPVVGNVLGAIAGDGIFRMTTVGMAGSPLVVVAAICFLAAACIALLPRDKMRGDGNAARSGAIDDTRIRHSLAHTAVVVLGITVAEVGLTLISRDTPVVRPSQVAGYFALCSAVMVAMQMWLYPALERWIGEPRLVTAAMTGMALGLALLARPLAPWMPVTGLVLGAAGIGVLIPALAVRISSAAGLRQGWALGRQSSAASLGQAIGAAATGVLYAQAAPLPFLSAAAVLAVTAWTAGRGLPTGAPH